jgi:hypothetical protein
MFLKTIKIAGLFGILTPLLLCAAGGFGLAQQSNELIKEESSRVELEIPGHHQEKQNRPKIAVTDLSYEERVAEYFMKYDLHESHSGGQSTGEGGTGFHDSSHHQSEQTEHLETGLNILIDRGELRKFTADIKGELIKSGHYRVVQGKPWISEKTDALYDIINRIKEGYYPNTDFVLFGSINTVDFRNESNPIQGSDAVNYSLSLELVAEFSLINTKTYEVVASFSATGEGKDSRLVNSPGTRASPDRGKVVRNVSQSLGVEVAKQIEEQFSPETK